MKSPPVCRVSVSVLQLKSETDIRNKVGCIRFCQRLNRTVLLVRFLAVNDMFKTRSGILGIHRGGGSKAHEIVHGTLRP